MNIKDIKQIVDLIKRADLTEFEIEEKDFKLRICRGKDAQPTFLTMGTPPYPTTLTEQTIISSPAASPTFPPTPAEKKEEKEKNIVYIKSPMVGTFYRSPSPDNPSFVDVGTQIKEDTVVCIIEAMKVMNEIQAELTGTIVKALVENGHLVEFGQPLFEVKKA